MNFSPLIKSLPWSKGVRLSSCDANGLFAVEKEAGVLSHPNKKSDKGRSLLGAPYNTDLQAFEVPSIGSAALPVYLLNRLDSATSGLLLLTTVPEIRDAVRTAFANRRVHKIYAALVFGNHKAMGNRIWKDRLSVSSAKGHARATIGRSGSEALTEVASAYSIPGTPITSFLTLKPITGRTHQLRAQCAQRNAPIVGDRTYGDFQKNKIYASVKGVKRLCLHSAETSLEYAVGSRTFKFKARSEVPFLPRSG